jgi:hypothetical protein
LTRIDYFLIILDKALVESISMRGIALATAVIFILEIIIFIAMVFIFLKNNADKRTELRKEIIKFVRLGVLFVLTLIWALFDSAYLLYSSTEKNNQGVLATAGSSKTNSKQAPVSIWFRKKEPQITIASDDKNPSDGTPTPRFYVRYFLTIENRTGKEKLVYVDSNFDQVNIREIFLTEDFKFEDSRPDFYQNKTLAKGFNGELSPHSKVDVDIVWRISIGDARSREFYDALKRKVHPVFSYHVTANTNDGEQTAANLEVDLQRALFEEYKKVFGEKPEWD